MAFRLSPDSDFFALRSSIEIPAMPRFITCCRLQISGFKVHTLHELALGCIVSLGKVKWREDPSSAAITCARCRVTRSGGTAEPVPRKRRGAGEEGPRLPIEHRPSSDVNTHAT